MTRLSARDAEATRRAFPVRSPAMLVAAGVMLALAGCGGGGDSSGGGGGGTTNNNPVATAASFTTAEDTAHAGTVAATDADGDTLTYSITVQPTHGSVTLTGSSYTYTPASNYNGSDSFTFRAADTRGGTGTAVVSITVSAVNDAPAVAAGSPALSIHSGGTVLTSIGSAAVGRAVVTLPDGKLIVAGDARATGGTYSDIMVARYTAAGVLDATFGTSGSTIKSAGARDDRGYALAVQADGKIIVAGDAIDGSNNSSLTVLRFNADGSVDTTFDTDGVATVLTGSGGTGSGGSGTSVAVQSDGKILVGGAAPGPSGTDLAVVRFNANGSVDTTFGGGDGIVLTSVSLATDAALGVAVQADGKIVAGGFTQVAPTNADFLVVRYAADGTLDTTFSGDGIATTQVTTGNDAASSIALQSDGKIVLAGTAPAGGSGDFDFTVVRYAADGTLDTTFSGDGIATAGVAASTNEVQYAVAVQPADGKILVGGKSVDGSANSSFAVLRLTAAGAVDTAFGSNGWLLTPLQGTDDVVYGLSVQSDGKIVATGAAANNGGKVALARYSASGALDAAFADDGINLPGEAFAFTVPASRFVDPDTGDTLTFTGSLSDGSALPATITFNDTTITFTGVVPTLPAGLRLTARDSANATGFENYSFAP